MSKRPGEDPIQPQDVSMQFDYDIGKATDFAADLLEDVNDHNVSAALRALNADDYDLACEFVRLEKEQAEAGELTPALNTKRRQLLARLKKAVEAADSDE